VKGAEHRPRRQRAPVEALIERLEHGVDDIAQAIRLHRLHGAEYDRAPPARMTAFAPGSRATRDSDTRGRPCGSPRRVRRAGAQMAAKPGLPPRSSSACRFVVEDGGSVQDMTATMPTSRTTDADQSAAAPSVGKRTTSSKWVLQDAVTAFCELCEGAGRHASGEKKRAPLFRRSSALASSRFPLIKRGA